MGVLGSGEEAGTRRGPRARGSGRNWSGQMGFAGPRFRRSGVRRRKARWGSRA